MSTRPLYSFNRLTPTQHAALVALASERHYQNRGLGNARRHEGARPILSVGEIILAMEKCLADARATWYRPDGATAALDDLRKVTALGFQALENHGAPTRLVYDERGHPESNDDYLTAYAIQDFDDEGASDA
jgi:hypothetical protein